MDVLLDACTELPDMHRTNWGSTPIIPQVHQGRAENHTSCADTLEAAIDTQPQLNELLQKACMHLCEWRTNSPDLLSRILEDLWDLQNVRKHWVFTGQFQMT